MIWPTWGLRPHIVPLAQQPAGEAKLWCKKNKGAAQAFCTTELSFNVFCIIADDDLLVQNCNDLTFNYNQKSVLYIDIVIQSECHYLTAVVGCARVNFSVICPILLLSRFSLLCCAFDFSIYTLSRIKI